MFLTTGNSVHEMTIAMAKACLSALCTLMIVSISWAQELTNPRLISFENELPGSWINSIAEDSLGFLWIGTNGGLVRYDGSRMKVYSHSPSEESIAGHRIMDILIIHDTLWCTHDKGITRIDLRNNTFRNFEFEIQNPDFRERGQSESAAIVMQLRDGSIWGGLRYDGMVRWDAGRDTFVRVRPPEDMVKPYYDSRWSADHIMSAVEDRSQDGVLWIGTMVGLLRLETSTGRYKFHRWELEDKEQETNLNSFRRVIQLPDGRICWGTWHTGTQVMDQNGESYERLENSSQDEDILRATVSEFTIVADTMLWVSTTTGVCAYDLKRKQIAKVWRDNYADNKIYRLEYIDKDHRAYGIAHDGLSVYDPLLQQFKGYSFALQEPAIRGMVFDACYDQVNDEYLVCARPEGVYRFKRDLNRWDRLELPYQPATTLTHNLRRTIGDKNVYIIQTGDHLYFYDARRRALTSEHYALNIPTGVIIDMAEDESGTIWLATNRDGIMQLDRGTGDIRQFHTAGVQTSSAGERGVFHLDSQGKMWIKKRRSIHVYDPRTDDVYDYLDERMRLPFTQTFAEFNGYMYFVSNWKLQRLPIDDYRGRSPDTITLSHGFPSAVAGNDGVIWGSSKSHIYRYSTRTGESAFFNFSYGDSPTELFNISFTEAGNIVLGDFERIIIVDPDDLRPNSELPQPYVSSMRIGNMEFSPGVRPGEKRDVELKHNENSFSLDIAAISHVLAGENHFRYRLADLQADWTPLNGLQTVNYNNVPSGKYTFELMAANNEGKWNEDVFELPITIATPWYASPLAELLGFLFVVLVVVLVYRYRVNQVRQQERLKTQYEKQLADVEMSALRAQMNPHFIFNCLSSIENFIVRNDTVKASSYLNDFARLIRLILQNSRTKFIPLREELEALELYLQLESLRFTDKFEYRIIVAPEVNVNDLEVPPMIIQPYVENAIWHGLIPKKEPGEITINISISDGVLKCMIEDDGIGRERSAEINSKRKHDKPKSMGMSITSERIGILNRLYKTNTTIDIIDKVDTDGSPAGTRVELNVPVE